MNARQKAKKYKRMYEALTAKWKPPIEFKVENYKIDTLNFYMTLDERLAVDVDKDYIKDVTINDLTQYLAKHFDEYVNWYIEHLPYTLKCRICYRIKILRKSESEEV